MDRAEDDTLKNSKVTKWATPRVLSFVILSLLLAPLARVAIADEGEQGSNLQVNVSENQAQISSQIRSSGVEKEFRAQMETSHGVRLEVEFDSATANMSRELELEATFAKLVEFTDSSGTLTSSSTVLQTIDLAQLSYSRVTANQVTVGGVQGDQLVAQGVQGNFTFKVVAYAFPSSLNINSTALSPSALKIVLYINNYPYTQANSLLALQVNTESDRSIDVSEADSQHAVKSLDSNLGEQAVFSWNGPLTVDGKSATLKISATSQGDEEKTLNVVYPHGKSIVHDPVLGVFLVGVPFYTQTNFIIGVAAVAILVVAVSVVIVTKKTRK